MKLLIHASLFASGSIEVDTETGQATFISKPVVQDDMAIVNPGSVEDAARASLRAVATLHKAIADEICRRVGGEEVTKPEKPLQLTNVLGGTGKASA